MQVTAEIWSSLDRFFKSLFLFSWHYAEYIGLYIWAEEKGEINFCTNLLQ